MGIIIIIPENDMTCDQDAGAQTEKAAAFLRLLQLADSALPIGALAHSFGLETLVAQELLALEDLPAFLQSYFEEAGVMQAVFCRAGFQAAAGFSADRWVELNEQLSALKPGRESRAGEAALGRRLLISVLTLGQFPLLQEALEAAQQVGSAIHHSPAFGLVSAVLAFEEEHVVLAFLHQLAANLVSGFQRLLPVGQNQAMRLAWDLKPAIVEATERSRTTTPEQVPCFMPLLDYGAMEHPALFTRLFIS
jgi:urease accessory protein